MQHNRPYVIVGASLAGATAAETLRERGYDGELVLVGDENERPYERPGLSKNYLQAHATREDLYVHDAAFYAANEIELRLGTSVRDLDPSSHTVTLDDGVQLPYERVLLATGSRPREVAIPGSDLDGVHSLRTARDADALRESLNGCTHLVIVGAGWIGSELAASARLLGLDVTVLDPLSAPLVSVVGEQVGSILTGLHESHGVRFKLGTAVESFHGDGALEGVRTTAGEVIPCDVAVVAVGAQPNVELAEHGGLALADGIAVDARLRASAPGVFAAGDVAAATHAFYGERVRVEHWDNARRQGAIAAQSMLDIDVTNDVIPYFFTTQYDVTFEYVGRADASDEVVLRGSPNGGIDTGAAAFWVRDGAVVAAMTANAYGASESLVRLIRSREPVDPARLADPGVAFDDLDGTSIAVAR